MNVSVLATRIPIKPQSPCLLLAYSYSIPLGRNSAPLYEAVQEPGIKDSEETIQNPFENESVFMSSKKRKYKDRRLNSLVDDDPDIAAELHKGNIVNSR